MDPRAGEVRVTAQTYLKEFVKKVTGKSEFVSVTVLIIGACCDSAGDNLISQQT